MSNKMSTTTKLLLVTGLTVTTGVVAFRWHKRRQMADAKRRRLKKRKLKQKKQLRKAA